MGVIAKGILRGCQGLFTPVSLRYPLSVFNKNSTLKDTHNTHAQNHRRTDTHSHHRDTIKNRFIKIHVDMDTEYIHTKETNIYTKVTNVYTAGSTKIYLSSK